MALHLFPDCRSLAASQHICARVERVRHRAGEAARRFHRIGWGSPFLSMETRAHVGGSESSGSEPGRDAAD